MSGILGPIETFSWGSLPEFYEAVRTAKPAVNAAHLVPHGVLRVAAMGWENRPPTEGELATMKGDLAEGMAAGAVGMSTGLIYAPGTFAKTDELIALARVVAEHGGIYVSHIRNEGERLLEAVAEAIKIGEAAGCPVQISHHKASGRTSWGRTKESLALIDETRARGIDMTMDVYPYTAASTALVAIARGGRIMTDADAHSIMVASVAHQHEYEGKRLDEIASMMDLPVGDAVERLLREEENTPVAIMFVMEEGDVRRVLQHRECMIGSDGLPSPTGKPHPRLYGTFPRVLGHYTRDEGLLSLEDAVRKMTSLPAKTFGLRDRGEVRADAAADLVIFDPTMIADTATFEDPRRYPSGIDYVLVNGVVAAEGAEPTASAAGQVLTRA